MSKMGRVVFEIMEKFDGHIPRGYTLQDYFRDKEKEHEKENTANRDNQQEDTDDKTIRKID